MLMCKWKGRIGVKIKKLTWQHVALVGILAFCLVLVVGIVSFHISQQQKRVELDQYDQMIEQKIDENAQLKDVINSGDIDEYAAGIARDQLGYGESDEKVYVNITGK